MYLSEMEPAMKPSDAFAQMAHREIDRVEIDNLEGAGHRGAAGRRIRPESRC